LAKNLMAGAVNDEPTAKTKSAISILQTLRSQIELYKLQHRDTPPNLSAGWNQLTGKTDPAGKIDAKAPFGPYLRNDPVNPLTGGSKVKIVDVRDASQLPRSGHKDADFVFESNGGRLYMVDAKGELFDER
jgi:hypothetical protein